MALTSVLFLGFLALVCVTAYLVPGKFRYVWLLLCSYGFYLYSSEGFTENLPALGLMLAATVISYICAIAIAATDKQNAKRIYMVISLASGLGMLLACKYLNFFLSGTGIGKLNLILPLGISYYTLQSVGYIIDVYSGVQEPEKNPLRYALFVSFFPSLVVGPINRASHMLPQYKNPKKFNYSSVSGGLFRILWGMFKKLVIADNLGLFNKNVFSELQRRSGPMVILAVLLFSYQLYMEFSGGIDIVIGSAKMLGFNFAENFNRPFSAKTYPALWQRWHMSLTNFLRDYLFTPLVWSRWTEKLPVIGKSLTKPPVISATIIVFTVSGLWHGADINYVIWGLFNGLFMALSQLIGKKREKLVAKIPVYRNRHIRGFFQRVSVYLMFSFCLIFFSSAVFGTDASMWFSRVASDWNTIPTGKFSTLLGQLGLDRRIIIALVIAALLVEIIEKIAIRKNSTIAEWIRKRKVFIRWPLYYVLLAGILFFGAFGKSPLIYQQY